MANLWHRKNPWHRSDGSRCGLGFIYWNLYLYLWHLWPWYRGNHLYQCHTLVKQKPEKPLKSSFTPTTLIQSTSFGCCAVSLRITTWLEQQLMSSSRMASLSETESESYIFQEKKMLSLTPSLEFNSQSPSKSSHHSTYTASIPPSGKYWFYLPSFKCA